jgi:hypothetical protein
MIPELLTTSEVAVLLRRPESTLRQWRSNRKGPVSFLLHGCVVYERPEVERWVEEQKAASRSDRKSA